ncbi:MAG: (2Fe-2S)-binding protein [Thaumarchaeota archaeon]|nr:(2Fe-2S)-binding protein [Nitrososphaerota archaeon]
MAKRAPKSSKKRGKKARHVKVSLNGSIFEADVEPRLLLVDLIRDVAGLTGTHVGCDTSNCGACTVLVDGQSVKSCSMFAVQVNGSKVQTIEGLAEDGDLHPMQSAFWENHGLQCGFCTPGMIIQASWLLKQNPNPTDDQIRAGISGNLCRCTGYVNIVKSIKAAAKEMRR